MENKKVQEEEKEVLADQETQPEEGEDPTRGKPSEFFRLKPLNPKFSEDSETNPLMLNQEQQDFMIRYFPDYVKEPFSTICWLC